MALLKFVLVSEEIMVSWELGHRNGVVRWFKDMRGTKNDVP